MKTTFTALLCTLALAATAPMAAERPQDRWNLADLYASAQAFSDDVARLESQFPPMAACKGHLGDSAKRMRECFDLQCAWRSSPSARRASTRSSSRSRAWRSTASR